MANAAKQDAISRRFVGHYLYLVINSNSHMAGKLEISRYYTSNSTNVVPTITGDGGTCPKPRISGSPVPNHYCPPIGGGGYTTRATALTSTVGAMHTMYNDAVPAGFGPLYIPKSVSSTCPGTSGQRANMVNYLHQHFISKSLPNGATGIVVFADKSHSEYRVVNAASHKFALVSGSNYNSLQWQLTDNCVSHHKNTSGSQKTPNISLPANKAFDKIHMGHGISQPQLGWYFHGLAQGPNSSPPRYFSASPKSIVGFGTGSHIKQR